MFGIVLASFLVTSNVHAAGIRPSRQTQVLDAGSSGIVTIAVENDESVPIQVQASVQPLAIQAAQQQISFEATHSADAWVTPIQPITVIAPGATAEVSYAISIPSYATPGSYPLGLVTTLEGNTNDQIDVHAQIISLFFLYVAGEIQEDVTIDSISLSDRFWLGTDPLTAQVRVSNNGGIHTDYSGMVELLSRDGTVLQTRPLTVQKRQLSMAETGVHTVTFFPLSPLESGGLSVRARIQYGSTNQTTFSQVSLWHIAYPIFLLGGIVLLAIVLSIIIRHVRKAYYVPVEKNQTS